MSIGCLIHGPGGQAALCGYGGVFGLKNLKAISALGSGAVPIADPKAFMDARLWFRQFQWDVDNPRDAEMFETGYSLINGSPSGGNISNGGQNRVPARAAACASCPRGCKMRLATADSNEAVCAGTMFANIGGGGMFGGGAKPGANAMPSALSQKLTRQANDLMHKYGLGHWQLMATRGYIDFLTRKGVIGKGERNRSRSAAIRHFRILRGTLSEDLVARGSFCEWAAEAAARMAEKLGRFKEDVSNGDLSLTYWGTQEHYSSQVEVEWGYGSLLGERDLMLHMMANYPLHWMAQSGKPYLTAEAASKLYAEAMVPYNDDRYLVDYGEGKKPEFIPIPKLNRSHGSSTMRSSGSAPVVSAAGDGRCALPTTPPTGEVRHPRPKSNSGMLRPGRISRLPTAWKQATRFTLLTGRSGTCRADTGTWKSFLIMSMTNRGEAEPKCLWSSMASGNTTPAGTGNWIGPRLKISKPGSTNSKATTPTMAIRLEQPSKRWA